MLLLLIYPADGEKAAWNPVTDAWYVAALDTGDGTNGFGFYESDSVRACSIRAPHGVEAVAAVEATLLLAFQKLRVRLSCPSAAADRQWPDMNEHAHL